MSGEFVSRQISPQRTGNRIRELRKASGLSVSRMSDLLGVTPSAVYRWELGKSLPDLGNVPNICGILGKTFEEIFICK